LKKKASSQRRTTFRRKKRDYGGIARRDVDMNLKYTSCLQGKAPPRSRFRLYKNAPGETKVVSEEEKMEGDGADRLSFPTAKKKRLTSDKDVFCGTL